MMKAVTKVVTKAVTKAVMKKLSTLFCDYINATNRPQIIDRPLAETVSHKSYSYVKVGMNTFALFSVKMLSRKTTRNATMLPTRAVMTRA
ncbi:hypothetical protein ATCV1_z429L [Acanthocystis turfacea chlorella virus 1]|uniref:Uncharacterized protein z429L n=1 Tax=Chlorovirus heliozoae TaxID=322019 RepID=A7K939_9PHYC|nr:hypothetical protein ATCV1_z429L [Acanthocystis turfacea chlorella virus 1]ABT16563.1 hypothetical protein ATCV1_z429L [Acanthocystis turfacea chlorella virus 1]